MLSVHNAPKTTRIRYHKTKHTQSATIRVKSEQWFKRYGGKRLFDVLSGDLEDFESFLYICMTDTSYLYFFSNINGSTDKSENINSNDLFQSFDQHISLFEKNMENRWKTVYTPKLNILGA